MSRAGACSGKKKHLIRSLLPRSEERRGKDVHGLFIGASLSAAHVQNIDAFGCSKTELHVLCPSTVGGVLTPQS